MRNVYNTRNDIKKRISKELGKLSFFHFTHKQTTYARLTHIRYGGWKQRQRHRRKKSDQKEHTNEKKTNDDDDEKEEE